MQECVTLLGAGDGCGRPHQPDQVPDFTCSRLLFVRVVVAGPAESVPGRLGAGTDIIAAQAAKMISLDPNAAGTAGFEISVVALDAAAGFDGNVSAAGTGSHPVAELGDKAALSVLGVEAVLGNVSISVSDLSTDAASAAIIRALHPKL